MSDLSKVGEILGSAMGAAAGFNKQVVIEAMELERARATLAKVTPPHAHDVVWAEVAHRQEFMIERHAYESVVDDMLRGRWDVYSHSGLGSRTDQKENS